MWPLTSEAQTSRNTIVSKLARRAEALKHAPVFSADEHQKYLNATGLSAYGAAFLAYADVGGRAATQIVENIQAKVWTATAVLEAYLARAAQAQDATNCLTEGARPLTIHTSLWSSLFFFSVFFEEAREEARKLDAEFAKTGELKGPLHGVPISVKDMCAFLPPFRVMYAGMLTGSPEKST